MNGTNLFSYRITFTGYAIGNRTSQAEANGDRGTWSYDEICQLTDDHKQASGGSTLYRRTFSYDAVGNRLTLTDEMGCESVAQGLRLCLGRLVQHG